MSYQDPFEGMEVIEPPPADSPVQPAGISEKQKTFLLSLRLERENDLALADDEVSRMTRQQASDMISKLLQCPKKQLTIREGMYRIPNGSIVKVQRAFHGSGNLYAKRLILPDSDAPAFQEGRGKAKGEWVYERGLIRQLKPEWWLTLEDAKRWGHLYGFCCVCGTILTNETSIANGIGPVCAEKGWW